VLVGAVLILTYGNKLGDDAKKAEEARTKIEQTAAAGAGAGQSTTLAPKGTVR
jgi:hypothetical protein